MELLKIFQVKELPLSEPVMHFHNKKAIEWMNFANISIAKATK